VIVALLPINNLSPYHSEKKLYLDEKMMMTSALF